MTTSQNRSTPTAGFGATRSINTPSASPSFAKKPLDTLASPAARTPQPAAKPVGLGSVNNGTSGSAPSGKSAIPRTSDASQLFADFFSDPKNATRTLDIDTQSVLAANPAESPKLKTLRKQILEIHPDGTTSPMPLYQDHVLFCSSMYLCTHTFGTLTGTRQTEVYLWTGNSVTQAHIESALSHAKKAAKDTSGTFLQLPQEKETPAFLQALGGILVTRKANSSSSKQPYLLRGRRHFGHLAFDEVDLHPSSLCPGYACILVTADESRIFVWKGAGANPEEIAGARLMAMDLCATADIVEIDSTSEPSAFFAAFPGNVTSADVPQFGSHWQLKRKHDAYRVRLFRIEHRTRDAPGQLSTVGAFWRAAAGKVGADGGAGATETRVEEIVPFCQRDLEADGVYVLDAFFEVYVYVFLSCPWPVEQNYSIANTNYSIVGPLARSAFPAFTAALLFAQEYAIVAASASSEDRPFVPVGHVVLEGAPADMRAVFRTWDAAAVHTEELMAGRAGGGERDVVSVGLAAAIAAVRGMGA